MQVPGYTGAPTVMPGTAPPREYLSAAGASPDAFGAQVGQGLEKVGAGLEANANVIEKHVLQLKGLQNDTEARDGDVNGMVQIGKLTADYNSLSGKAAVDAYPGYIAAVTKVREDVANGMSNPMAKKMFDDVFVRRVGFAISNGASHAAAQQKAYALQTGAARTQLMQQDAANNSSDDEHFNNSLGAITDQVRNDTRIAGLAPEDPQTQVEVQKAVSHAWDLRLQTMAMTDPMRAKSLLDKNRESLTPEVQKTLDKTIENAMVTTDTRGVANSIINGKDPGEPPAGPMRANYMKVGAGFGDPVNDPNFKAAHITTISTSSGHAVEVNKEAGPAFDGFLKDLEGEGYKINTIAGYNVRQQNHNGVAGSMISQHSFGNAIDINAGKNPQGGSANDLPENIEELAARHGLVWGGTWSGSSKDPMHFEYAGSGTGGAVASTGGAQYFRDLHAKENPNDSTTPSAAGAGGDFQFTPSTWSSVMKQHPELGLTETGRTGDSGQQAKAIKAFTADNAQTLQAANIPVNDKNLYMMHFMGVGGGPVFLQKMADSPNENAAEQFPGAATKNHSVFYNPDGSARTLQQVYDVQTASFGNKNTSGALPALTADSTTGQLDAMLKRAQDVAEQRMPGNETYADMLQTRIKNQFNTLKAAQADQETARFQSVQSMVYGDGTADHPGAKSLDEVLNSSPDARAAWFALTPEHQHAMMEGIAKNSKGETVTLTEPRYQRFMELSGLADTDPAKFSKMDIVSEDLPKAQIGELITKQRALQTQGNKDPNYTEVMAMVKKTAGSLDTELPEAQYNTLAGALMAEAKQYQSINKKPMDPQLLAQTASALLRKTVTTGGFLGWGSTQHYQFELPDAARSGIIAAYQARGVANPTDYQIYKAYLAKRPSLASTN